MRDDDRARWLNFYDNIAKQWEVIDHLNILNRQGVVVKTPHWEDANLVVESARPLVHSFGICCHISKVGYERIYSIKERENHFIMHGVFPPTNQSGFMAAFPFVPSSERFSVACGIGGGAQFSEIESTRILNVLSMFEWYSPYRVYCRSMEVDIPKLERANCDAILEMYLPLIQEMFGYTPSKPRVASDIKYGKMWFSDMSGGE